MKNYFYFFFAFFFSVQIFSQNLKISNGEITIPINTELKITVQKINNKLSDFKLINESKIEKPINMIDALANITKKDIVSDEIEFKFSNADLMGSKIIILTTVQHLKSPITFKAKIKIKGGTKYYETSIVKKIPNVFSVEQWRDDIESVFLYDFKIAEN